MSNTIGIQFTKFPIITAFIVNKCEQAAGGGSQVNKFEQVGGDHHVVVGGGIPSKQV